MSHDSHFAGDPATFANTSEGIQEVECDCGWSGEVGTNEDYSHGIVSWIAESKCPSCDESHTSDGEYEDDGTDPDSLHDDRDF